MNGVDVITGIPHMDPISLAFLQMNRGRGYFVGHWVSDSVNGPAIEALFGSIVFGKDHLESFVRGWSGRARPSKTSIVPAGAWRHDPLWFAHISRILHHNSHAMASVVIGSVPHDPNSWMVHLHNG